MMPWGLMLAAVLFVLGLAGLLARRNLLLILVSIEVMLNAAGVAFIAAGSGWNQPDGQVMFLFILAVAAAEVAVGLALVLQLHHQYDSVDIDAASQLRDTVDTPHLTRVAPVGRLAPWLRFPAGGARSAQDASKLPPEED